jgi:hypothetical protein
MLVGTLGWGIVARLILPHAFAVGTLLIWLAIVTAMAVATLVASTATIYGGRAVGANAER